MAYYEYDHAGYGWDDHGWQTDGDGYRHGQRERDVPKVVYHNHYYYQSRKFKRLHLRTTSSFTSYIALPTQASNPNKPPNLPT